MKAAYAGFDIFFRKSGCKPNRTLLYSLFSRLSYDGHGALGDKVSHLQALLVQNAGEVSREGPGLLHGSTHYGVEHLEFVACRVLKHTVSERKSGTV